MTDDAGPIWRRGAFQADEWQRILPDAGLPSNGSPALVQLAPFLADPERFVGYNGPLGITVAPGEAIEPLKPYLPRIALIALAFPRFSDGRNYSTARLLRERLGFRGELRAVGDVLADQIPLMRRCGIETFEVSHGPTRKALLTGSLAEMRHYYQPIPDAPEVPAGTRPWLRQPAQ